MKFFKKMMSLTKLLNQFLQGKAVGWFQGRTKFGLRALGGRSILADPKEIQKCKKILTLKVKFRESFRPFAPSVLIEDVAEWFEIDRESPYMLIVADVKKGIQKFNKEQNLILKGLDKLNIERSKYLL